MLDICLQIKMAHKVICGRIVNWYDENRCIIIGDHIAYTCRRKGTIFDWVDIVRSDVAKR